MSNYHIPTIEHFFCRNYTLPFVLMYVHCHELTYFKAFLPKGVIMLIVCLLFFCCDFIYAMELNFTKNSTSKVEVVDINDLLNRFKKLPEPLQNCIGEYVGCSKEQLLQAKDNGYIDGYAQCGDIALWFGKNKVQVIHQGSQQITQERYSLLHERFSELKKPLYNEHDKKGTKKKIKKFFKTYDNEKVWQYLFCHNDKRKILCEKIARDEIFSGNWPDQFIGKDYVLWDKYLVHKKNLNKRITIPLGTDNPLAIEWERKLVVTIWERENSLQQSFLSRSQFGPKKEWTKCRITLEDEDDDEKKLFVCCVIDDTVFMHDVYNVYAITTDKLLHTDKVCITDQNRLQIPDEQLNQFLCGNSQSVVPLIRLARKSDVPDKKNQKTDTIYWLVKLDSMCCLRPIKKLLLYGHITATLNGGKKWNEIPIAFAYDIGEKTWHYAGRLPQRTWAHTLEVNYVAKKDSLKKIYTEKSLWDAYWKREPKALQLLLNLLKKDSVKEDKVVYLEDLFNQLRSLRNKWEFLRNITTYGQGNLMEDAYAYLKNLKTTNNHNNCWCSHCINSLRNFK